MFQIKDPNKFHLKRIPDEPEFWLVWFILEVHLHGRREDADVS